MAGEAYAHHVPDLAFVPIGRRPDVADGTRRGFVVADGGGFQAQVEIVRERVKFVDEFIARLLLEVVDAAVSVWGADRVGVRISPVNSYNDMRDSDPVALTTYVAGQLNARGIAYLHLMRADFFGLQKADLVPVARAAFKGSLIGNMGYTGEEADLALASGALDAVAFGHYYVSNPDLVERLAAGVALVEPDARTFYSNDAVGYTDYPTMNFVS